MKYDITMVGHISRDIMIYKDEINRFTGGPVIYSSIAAARAGKKIQVITKASKDSEKELTVMRDMGITVIRIDSERTTSIENIYYTPDKEKRKVTLLTQAEPFREEDIPAAESDLFHLAGLFRGEIPDSLVKHLHKKGRIAIDAQGLLRCSDDGCLVFRDWESKTEYLPLISFFKADAAEALILTGEENRERAALKLASWGAEEIMITHNTEILVYSKRGFSRAPFTPANLSGRTGRGDTAFAAYLAWRLDHGEEESVRFAAALCSIKMESPGPFSGTLSDVMTRMDQDSPIL